MNHAVSGKGYERLVLISICVMLSAITVWPCLGSVQVMEVLRKQAEAGDGNAQFLLGKIYEHGEEGIPRNRRTAKKWYREASEKEHAEAQFRLAMMYMSGNGIRKNVLESIRWLRKSAVQGNAQAQLILGIVYVAGFGIPQDAKIGADWVRKSARQGNLTAQRFLGMHYGGVTGLAKDTRRSGYWYRKAARREDKKAQGPIVKFYLEGSVTHKNASNGTEWPVADNPGNRWRLSRKYTIGDRVSKDTDEGMEWITKAADQSNPAAQYILGLLHKKGAGVPKDLEKAKYWLKEAAAQGVEAAIEQLEEIGSK